MQITESLRHTQRVHGILVVFFVLVIVLVSLQSTAQGDCVSHSRKVGNLLLTESRLVCICC